MYTMDNTAIKVTSEISRPQGITVSWNKNPLNDTNRFIFHNRTTAVAHVEGV